MKIEFIQKIHQPVSEDKRTRRGFRGRLGSTGNLVNSVSKKKESSLSKRGDTVVHVYAQQEGGDSWVVLDKKGVTLKQAAHVKQDQDRNIKRYQANGVYSMETDNQVLFRDKVQPILGGEGGLQVVVMGDRQAQMQLVKGQVDGSDQGLIQLITATLLEQGPVTMEVMALQDRQKHQVVASRAVNCATEVSLLMRTVYNQTKSLSSAHLLFSLGSTGPNPIRVQVVQLFPDPCLDLGGPHFVTQQLHQFHFASYPRTQAIFVNCLSCTMNYHDSFLALQAFKDLSLQFQPYFSKQMQLYSRKHPPQHCSEQGLAMEQLQERLDQTMYRLKYASKKYKSMKQAYRRAQERHSQEVAGLHSRLLQKEQAGLGGVDQDTQYRLNKILIDLQEKEVALHRVSMKADYLVQQQGLDRIRLDKLREKNQDLLGQREALRAKETQYMRRHYDYQDQQDTLLQLQEKLQEQTRQTCQLEEELHALHQKHQVQMESVRESHRQNQHKHLEDYRSMCQQVDGLVQEQGGLDQQNRILAKENQQCQEVIASQTKRIQVLEQEIREMESHFDR